MNAIRQVQALNKRELENAVPPEASWHADYRDTAYIYIGGLPFDLSEGDIITIFSQYGEPVHINLARDKETGKSRGFAFLKYEDQRSTDLAVDNLGGATVMGRILRVDHARYKRRDDESEEDNVAKIMGDSVPAGRGDDTDDERRHKKRRTSEDEGERRRPLLKEERELQELIINHDEEDPMKEFLIEEKKEEVARALEKFKTVSDLIDTAIDTDTDEAKRGRLIESGNRAGTDQLPETGDLIGIETNLVHLSRGPGGRDRAQGRRLSIVAAVMTAEMMRDDQFNIILMSKKPDQQAGAAPSGRSNLTNGIINGSFGSRKAAGQSSSQPVVSTYSC
ncbi:RNA binding domain protein [Paecilomyces variotii No. 5]|uniref:RNA binding domain protein n=1 Tax=Byssochlamys spectabilis (strain No. 5 / NBRC 109023) TaxID=1356009 RepID=V5G6J1_BYSSN|nr:RNA binding domain protein [Paecilomyces variotii No. 5]